MAHSDAREVKWRGNWRMVWVASTLHNTSEHAVSSITTITTADAHTTAESSRMNWHPCRFIWIRPFRRKTKSGFCACVITFHTQSKYFARDTYTSTKPKFHWLEAVANTRTYSSTTYSYFIRDFTASLTQVLILCSTFSNVIFVWLTVIHNTAILTKNHTKSSMKTFYRFRVLFTDSR